MSATGVGVPEVVQAWGRILAGRRPNLSIEITKECPLRCPGCYAYGDEHLGGNVTLRGLSDYKGDELVARFMALIDRHPAAARLDRRRRAARPIQELNAILPQLAERGIHTQLVTSAVRPIPSEWRRLNPLAGRRVDRWSPAGTRRSPHAGDLRTHPQAHRGHQITVHCTVTRQQVRRDGYLQEFLDYWQANPNTRLIWISLYTPQIGELSTERLTKADRDRVIADLSRMRKNYSKLQMLDGMLKVYATPPDSPETASSRRPPSATRPISSGKITPCQFGGKPDCQNCGCIASAGLEAIGRHRLKGGIPVGKDLLRVACGRAHGRQSQSAPSPPPNGMPPRQPEQAQ